MPAPSRAKQPLVLPDDNLPLEERVRQKVRESYVNREHQSGAGVEDWLQAEDEIRSAEDQKKGHPQ